VRVLLGRPIHGWNDNINIVLKELEWEGCGLMLLWIMGREHGSEPSVSINCVEFCEYLMGCWFLERGFTALSLLVSEG
jgi:hypothetical protein